jgi:uncharacterized protein (DUF1778 family)
MITNDQQLKITLDKIKTLEESLELKPEINNSSLIIAAKLQTTSVIEELKQQVAEYRKLNLRILVSKEDYEQIEEEIANPSEPNEYLKASAKRFKEKN